VTLARYRPSEVRAGKKWASRKVVQCPGPRPEPLQDRDARKTHERRDQRAPRLRRRHRGKSGFPFHPVEVASRRSEVVKRALSG